MSKNTIRYAKLSGDTENGGAVNKQRVEYFGKTADSVILFPYGVLANVPPENLGVMLAVQDNSDNRITMPMDVKALPTLEAGDVAVYSPVSKSIITIKASGDIEITGNDTININATTVNVNADAVNLGESGEPIGRVGDAVEVTIPMGTFLTAATGAGVVATLNAAPVTVMGEITAGGVNTSL